MDLTIFMEYLLEFKYPIINVLSKTEEIANVFGMENRLFFLSWIIKYIGSYELPTEKNKLELVLAEIIHENGLCTSSQKQEFVNGMLSVAEQLVIITRLFKYAKLKSTTIQTQEKFTIEDLNASMNRDLNLFPIYGPVKLVKPTQINKYQQRIDDLTKLIESMHKELNQKENIDIASNMEDININGLTDHIKTLEKKLVWFLKVPDESKNDIEFISDLPGLCSEETKIISRSIKSMKIISNFQNNCKEAPINTVENQELLTVIKQLSQMSEELIV